ncbi:hypothetical protein L1987_36559 [Smallanthus sonchifolius]|uniref:Uncharacterized protein n=1 Tax=Smallanthus sonchifolius TaxID=185202 RepID=A0ACB9HF46_9ASTR|nr:hypothetical protein L1987_36559 [Smallanthus sonchifolius]
MKDVKILLSSRSTATTSQTATFISRPPFNNFHVLSRPPTANVYGSLNSLQNIFHKPISSPPCNKSQLGKYIPRRHREIIESHMVSFFWSGVEFDRRFADSELFLATPYRCLLT